MIFLRISEEDIIRLYKENARLKEIIKRLQRNNKELEDRLIKCPVTGLFNYEFFKDFFSNEIREIVSEGNTQNPGLVVISFDNISNNIYSYGDSEVNSVLKNSVYIIESIKEEKDVIFKLHGVLLLCYLPDTNKEKIVEFAEEIRVSISTSEKFIEKVTVSIGVIYLDEIRDENTDVNNISELMYKVALMRVKIAKNMGMDIVCSNSDVEVNKVAQGKILLVDTDEINTNVLNTFLKNINYEVIIARDGAEALSIVENNKIALIVSEIMIPKIDGFLVREKLLTRSDTKNIPFIIMSHLKDSNSVERASSLGVGYYFKKPLMISEFIGVVKNIIKGESN